MGASRGGAAIFSDRRSTEEETMSHAMQRFGEANQELTDILTGALTDRIVVWSVTAGRMEIRVDLYDPVLPGHFDTDAWEAAHVFIDGPATRAAFREAWTCARSLVAGRTVIDRDGDIVLGRCRS